MARLAPPFRKDVRLYGGGEKDKSYIRGGLSLARLGPPRFGRMFGETAVVRKTNPVEVERTNSTVVDESSAFNLPRWWIGLFCAGPSWRMFSGCL